MLDAFCHIHKTCAAHNDCLCAILSDSKKGLFDQCFAELLVILQFLYRDVDITDADNTAIQLSKKPLVPADGVILPSTTVTFSEGESVFDVLQRVCQDNKIHMESVWTPMYNSAYVEGIHNLYEFDVGSLSGWMYSVNGWFPNYGCSRYQVKDGDVVEWRYTCDLGYDLGSGMGG